MKSLWNSFKIAFSMFSKIPMPQAEWTEDNMKYMLCFFPFIGAAIGILMIGARYLLNYLGFADAFISMILVLIPVIVTGGIHIDGLLDTSDALSSWREREKRLEILKDSHAGAFAVITACVYFVAVYGGMNQLLKAKKIDAFLIFAAGFMMARCLSGIGVITLPKANAGGTVAEFSRKASDKVVKNVLIIYLVIIAICILICNPAYGVAQIICAGCVFAFYRYKAMKYFGGTTGDLSGYFVCLCELWMLIVMVVVSTIY